MKPAAQLLLGAVFSLLAIAPIPFQKWALPRIAFGGFALVCFGQAKKKTDNELSLQRQVDVYEFEQLTQQRQIAQGVQAIEIQATQERELVRTQFHNELEKARMQEHFVVAMEHERPGYLEYQEAQRIANLQSQNQGYSTSVQDGGRAIEVEQEEIELSETPAYLRSFIATTCLIWGNQGGGKSWLVRYLAKLKVDKGYRLIVFDPNSNRTSWQGVELINKYADIELMMRWYVDEVQRRYGEFTDSEYTEEEWRERLWRDGFAISIICEEVTTYEDFIEDKELLKLFIKVAATLSRKQEMPVMFVTHNNTQTCFGNIKGLGNLINNLQQVELIPKTDPTTSQPVASGLAKIRIEGSTAWTEVKVPAIRSKIVNFGAKTITKTIAEPTNPDIKDATNPESSTPIASIEAQKAQLDATFKKEYNPLDHLLQEASQDDLEEMIRSWRELADTSVSEVSDASIPQKVSDTSEQEYQALEPLPDKESQGIWTEEDFAKHLPKKDERQLFEKLLEYQDESQDASKIIKNGWGFTSKYQIGKACFVYLITKYGGDGQKKLYADYINQYLGVNSQDDGAEG